MKVYSEKNICCGCRSCEQICPVKCIKMVEDEEGFLYPVIDETRCVKCGKCQSVCKQIGKDNKADCKLVYAVRNCDDEIRKNSSSGGVFWAVAEYVLNHNGVVFGAVFDENYRVHHIGSTNKKQVRRMCGSKYVQSDTEHTFSETEQNLKENRLVLYSGTPCQIAGLKSYLGNDYANLFCVSIICHGVPSPQIWQSYLEYKQFLSKAPFIDIKHRDKKNAGWRKADIVFETEGKRLTETYTDNLFIKGFLQNLYLRPSCHVCRGKGIEKGADLILGDYWGIEKYHPELDDNLGVSAVIAVTQKGKKLLDSVYMNITVLPSNLEYIKQANASLIKSSPCNNKRKAFFDEISVSNDIEKSIRSNIKPTLDNKMRAQYLYPIILKYLKNKVEGYDIGTFFENQKFYNIVLYAVSDLTQLLTKDIDNSPTAVRVCCICDKNAGSFEGTILGQQVIGIEELIQRYQNGEVDCVVVGNVFAEHEIFHDLISKGIKEECILSVNSIIFSFGD